MDGQCRCGLEEETTLRGGEAKPVCVEAIFQILQSRTKVGKDAVEAENENKS